MTRERKQPTVKQSSPPVDRLSWGDTIFLNLEREGMPMNVASVCIFEGELRFKDFFRFIESKLPLVPRYLKRVVQPPFGLGLPTWEFDQDFDLRRHVREVTLKHGTETELKALASKLFSKLMDRQHPLWDMTLVPQLKGGRTGVVIRLHHCLTDGVAGVGMMNAFFNPDAQVSSAIPLNIAEVSRPSDALASLTTGLVETYSDFMQRVLSGLNDVLTIVQRATATATANGGTAAKGGGIPPEEFSLLLPEITALTERMRFNVVCHGPQKFAWTEISLAEVKAIKSKFGASVNDVILAVVTATFRRYLEAHGDTVKGRLLRMMVPVNTRNNGGADELGNNISLIPVTVPLDIRDPKKLLEAVHRRSEFLKRAHAAELVGLTGGLIGLFPNGLQAIAGPILSQLPITPFNLVCTNVPGPQFPLYLLGHKMLRWYPYVPIGGEMAVNCAILSYDGMMYFGFSGNVHAAPDLRRLEAFVKESFAELRQAAGIKTVRKRVVARNKAHAKSNAHTKKRGKSAPQKPVNGSPLPKPNVSVPPPEAEPSLVSGTEKERESALLNTQ